MGLEFFFMHSFCVDSESLNQQRVDYGDNSTGGNSISNSPNATFQGKFCWVLQSDLRLTTVKNIGEEVYEKITVDNLVVKNQPIGVVPSKVPVGYYSFYYL